MSHHIDSCKKWDCDQCDRDQSNLTYCSICLRYEGNSDCKHDKKYQIKSGK